MNKSICIIFLLFTATADAQTWSAVGTGMYHPLFTPSVNAISSYNGEIYAGGTFDYADGFLVNNIAKWDSTSWQPLGTGVIGTVTSMAEYNGELYVAGNFHSAGGIPVNLIAKWDGLNWSDISSGLKGNSISALAVYNGNLYAAGNIDSVGIAAAHNIAKWDGSNWTSVGNWMGGHVLSLTILNNELYVGGPAFFISKWNDTTWTSIPVGTNSPVEVIVCLASFNGELYAGGRFDSIGSINANNIAKWNGSWAPLSTGTDHVSQDDIVYSITSYNGKVYMGGYFSSAGGNLAGNIAMWNGSNWSSVGGGVNNIVSSLHAINNELYVGGRFTMAGSISANHIARWNLPLGTGHLSPEDPVSIFPNPFLNKLEVLFNSNVPSEILLYDIASRKILQQTFTNSFTLNTEQLESGVYLYEVRNKNGVIRNGKVVKD